MPRLALAVYSGPPTTAGCAERTVSPWNANAHFSLRLGTSSAPNPGLGWWREFARSALHPFQSASLIVGAPEAVEHFPARAAAPAPNSLPVTKRAMARPSSLLQPVACQSITPPNIAW